MGDPETLLCSGGIYAQLANEQGIQALSGNSVAAELSRM
jgi:hypothetical protein